MEELGREHTGELDNVDLEQNNDDLELMDIERNQEKESVHNICQIRWKTCGIMIISHWKCMGWMTWMLVLMQGRWGTIHKKYKCRGCWVRKI